MSALVTPDRRWRVEVIVVDGRPEFRVTLDGAATLPWRRFKDQGRVHTVDAVITLMGEATFATLITER